MHSVINELCDYWEKEIAKEVVAQMDEVNMYWENMDEDIELQMEIIKNNLYA